MKKRAAKTKRAAKPSAAKKAGARTKKPAAKKPAAKTVKSAVTVTPKATPYTPAPLKGDGWPPFRYPLQ
jgi:hypothetical protein